MHTFDIALGVLRAIFFAAGLIVAGLCAVDWCVRTKRLNPFSTLARMSRRFMTPWIRPVESAVVRAGGSPASAPWWTLAAALMIGILILSAFDFIRGQISGIIWAVDAGPRGILRLIVGWLFALFYLALIVRVFSSWFRISALGPFVRWSFALTEPVLAPLRRVLTFGMIDFSPIAAWFLLSWLIEPLVMRVL